MKSTTGKPGVSSVHPKKWRHSGSKNHCRNRHLNAPKLFCVIEKYFGNYELSQCDIPLCAPSNGLVVTEHNNYCRFPFKDAVGKIRERCVMDQETDFKCYAGIKRRGVRQLEACIHSFKVSTIFSYDFELELISGMASFDMAHTHPVCVVPTPAKNTYNVMHLSTQI